MNVGRSRYDNVAAGNPTIYNAMYEAILELNQTVFSPIRGNDDNLACELAMKEYGFSFWWPYPFLDGGA